MSQYPYGYPNPWTSGSDELEDMQAEEERERAAAAEEAYYRTTEHLASLTPSEEHTLDWAHKVLEDDESWYTPTTRRLAVLVIATIRERHDLELDDR